MRVSSERSGPHWYAALRPARRTVIVAEARRRRGKRKSASPLRPRDGTAMHCAGCPTASGLAVRKPRRACRPSALSAALPRNKGLSSRAAHGKTTVYPMVSHRRYVSLLRASPVDTPVFPGPVEALPFHDSPSGTDSLFFGFRLEATDPRRAGRTAACVHLYVVWSHDHRVVPCGPCGRVGVMHASRPARTKPSKAGRVRPINRQFQSNRSIYHRATQRRSDAVHPEGPEGRDCRGLGRGLGRGAGWLAGRVQHGALQAPALPHRAN